MKKFDVIGSLQKMEKKYCDLVWFARKNLECLKDDHPSMPQMVRIKMQIPAEIKKLSSDEADWHHGFNSGCLAAFRFAIGMLGDQGDRELAEDEFPMLDT